MSRQPSKGLMLRLRLLSEWAIWLLVAVVIWQTWYLEGLFAARPIVGPSMAPALLGPHYRVVCRQCGFRFVCDAENDAADLRIWCPNCGYAGNSVAAQSALPGERVLIHRTAFCARRPRRGEVVAFRRPGRETEVTIKRVLGLPGESVQIVEGDVYIDGQIVRKSLAEQLAVAQLVYDADHPPATEAGLPARWEAQGMWGTGQGRFAHPATSPAEQIDWLTYRHWQRLPGDPRRTRPAPVEDLCAYNQTQPRRREDVHEITDLMLTFRLVETFGAGALIVRATDGSQRFEVRLDAAQRRYEVFHDGEPLPGTRRRLQRVLENMEFCVSLFDQQFLLAVDGKTEVVWPYVRPETHPRPSVEPLAIGSKGLGVRLEQVRVYRDIYYTVPIGLEDRPGLGSAYRLDYDEYYVLGDNSPVSDDSRSWTAGPAVKESLLVGKPLIVVYAPRRVVWGGWTFHIPDPGRLRYIR